MVSPRLIAIVFGKVVIIPMLSAFTSSPVGNDGKIFIAGEDGDVIVLKAGPVFERIATNQMTSPVLATPAISEGRLLLRTQKQIMAIGTK